METFADYILKETNFISKIDIFNRLQRLLKERRGITIFFNNTVIFKAEIARMFIDYAHIDEVDRNLVLTACLLCNCKKIDGPQSLESLHSYAKKGADFLESLGFDKRFCKICEEYFAPEDIMWTCKICKTEFKSDIKIYCLDVKFKIV